MQDKKEKSSNGKRAYIVFKTFWHSEKSDAAYYQISILHPPGHHDLCSQKTQTGKGNQQRANKAWNAALKGKSGGTQRLQVTRGGTA